MAVPVIINPTSGQGKAVPRIEDIARRLTTAGMEPEIMVTTMAGDARAFAEQAAGRGCDTVIVAGGDGTVNEVLNGLKGSPVRLGLIPLGTGNVLAREWNIPRNDIAAACDVIARGRTHTLDLATVNGRYFALMVGMGFDADVVRSVIPSLKNAVGAAAYSCAIMGAFLRLKPAVFTLEMDGERVQVNAAMVVVANSGSYADNFKIAPEARMDDGLLNVCVLAAAWPERITLLRQAWHIVHSTHHNAPYMSYRCTRNVRISASPLVSVQIDGDEAGTTPVSVELVPEAIKLLVGG